MEIFKRDSLQMEKCLTICRNGEFFGEIHFQEKNSAMALEAFKKALSLDPRNPLAMGFLAGITTDTPLLEAAIGTFDAKCRQVLPGFGIF